MKTDEAKELVGTILKRMRWDSQDGYPCYRGDGRWDFVSMGLPQVSPEELNKLFEFAGIEPDIIVPKGVCSECGNSIKTDRGERVEQGYSGYCRTCNRPRMSNWRPIGDDEKE